MIKIDKAPITEAPQDFISRGMKRTQLDCKFYDNPPRKYITGKVSFPKVTRSVYQLAKDKLNESHYFKCCYCEKKFDYKGELDVEHFRPTRFSKQSKNGKEFSLVYFWLAYDWDNLLLSCPTCNRVYKGNLFPLENPARRAEPQVRNITHELPTFINPSKECPRKHITFVNETPASKCRRGKETIQGLGLRRRQLFEDRLEHLDKIRSYLKDIEMWADFVRLVGEENIQANPKTTRLLKHHEEKGLKAILFLQDSIKKDAKFSSMAQDFLAQYTFNQK
jgi:hypothetical protein